MAAYMLNTNTGVLVPKTPILDPKPYLVPYMPTQEEARIGRKIEKPVVPSVAAVQKAPAPFVEPAVVIATTEFDERDQGLDMDAYAAPSLEPRRRGRPKKSAADE